MQLNNAAVPAVPHMSEAELEAVRTRADVAIAVVDERDSNAVLGFLLALRPGADYDSENYRWFEGRGADGIYVDRIVVAESARGLGLGATLYSSVFAAAGAEGRAEVTCEVNLEPPNPGSLAFHARLGFVEVGRQSTKSGSVVVSLMAAPITRDVIGVARPGGAQS